MSSDISVPADTTTVGVDEEQQKDHLAVVAMTDRISWLQNEIEIQREKVKPLLPASEIVGGLERATYPVGYCYKTHFPYGSYRSGIYQYFPFKLVADVYTFRNALEMGLYLLTKLLQGTLESRPFLVRQRVLSPQESLDLFLYFSLIWGFYNFLPYHNRDVELGDIPALGADLSRLCDNVFFSLCEQVPLEKETWDKLVEAATIRAKHRLTRQYALQAERTLKYDSAAYKKAKGLGDKTLYTDTNTVDGSIFYLHRTFEPSEIPQLSMLVVQGELEQLQNFIGNLHRTLRVFSAVARSQKREELTQEKDIVAVMQSLLTMLQSSKSVVITDAESPEKITIVDRKHEEGRHIYVVKIVDNRYMSDPLIFEAHGDNKGTVLEN